MQKIPVNDKIGLLEEEIRSETAKYITAVGENTDQIKESRNNLSYLQNELVSSLKQQVRENHFPALFFSRILPI
jgi:hypothetical protein